MERDLSRHSHWRESGYVREPGRFRRRDNREILRGKKSVQKSETQEQARVYVEEEETDNSGIIGIIKLIRGVEGERELNSR